MGIQELRQQMEAEHSAMFTDAVGLMLQARHSRTPDEYVDVIYELLVLLGESNGWDHQTLLEQAKRLDAALDAEVRRSRGVAQRLLDSMRNGGGLS